MSIKNMENSNATEWIVGKVFSKWCGARINIEPRKKQKMEEAVSKLNVDLKRILLNQAGLAVETILKIENNFKPTGIIEVKFTTISSGRMGDVRDLILLRSIADDGIGISVKHNSEEAKANRISPKIDIGTNWGLGCKASPTYFKQIEKVFSILQPYYNNLWTKVPFDKFSKVYQPLLMAVADELSLMNNKKGSSIGKKLVDYMIGTHDFYKIELGNKPKISAFNFEDTLATCHSLRPTRIEKMEIVGAGTNRLLINMDRGWNLSMRIHNASRKVESSLKFSVTIMSPLPNSIDSTPIEVED